MEFQRKKDCKIIAYPLKYRKIDEEKYGKEEEKNHGTDTF